MPLDYDKITSTLVDDLDRIEKGLITRIEAYLKTGIKDIPLAQLDAELDIFQVLNDLGYEGKVRQFFSNYDEIVKQLHNDAIKRGLNGIVGVTAQDLEIIANNNEIFALDKGRLYGSQFKSTLLEGVISGQPFNETIKLLQGTKLADTQLRVGLNQGITRFESIGIGKIYEEDPEQRFGLFGPLDSVTRDECANALSIQPAEGWTRAEIDAGAAGAGYTWVDRGGYNCRHQWVPI